MLSTLPNRTLEKEQQKHKTRAKARREKENNRNNYNSQMSLHQQQQLQQMQHMKNNNMINVEDPGYWIYLGDSNEKRRTRKDRDRSQGRHMNPNIHPSEYDHHYSHELADDLDLVEPEKVKSKPIQIKKHQFQLIHKTFNSTVYKSTFKTGRGYILKRIKNTKGGQYELLQTKYSNKICPEYTLPIIRNKSSSNHIYILQPEYGMSLYDFMVQRGAALIESELRFIYGHVALALFRLHEKAHLAHLDIKEENILINPETLHPVLIDFATCRPLKKTATSPQHLPKQLGSAGFAAPELCRGDPINDLSKCDVYSYGVALFSSLTGTYPTTDPNTGKLNQQRPEIMSVELWEVISACIYAKSPMERPSLEELLEFDFFRM